MLTARVLVLVMGAVLGLAGCAVQERREWMKVGQPYSVEEFRRDHAECSTNDTLNEDCLRKRGWVDVAPKPEKPVTAEPRRLGPPRR
jgi:hypothetical protein